jgi:TolA-binding protein
LRYAGKIDANNTTTLRYLKEVNTRLKEKGKDKKKGDDLISYQSGNETIIMPRRFQESSLGSTLAYVVIGLLVGVAVTAFLIVPGIQNKANQDASQKLVEASDTISSQAQMLTTLESQIANLEAQITELQNLSQQDPQELVSYEALINGYAANATGDIYTAGTYLEQVDTSHLSESALAIYTPIWESIYVAYYEQVYANAYAFYNAENFVEAIPLFVKLVEVDKGYKEGSVAYYLAQSYRRNGDMASARPYYQYVLDNYPNTEHARTAANYMKEE